MTKRTTRSESLTHGIVAMLRKHSTSTLSEVMGKRGYMNHEIKPITPDIKLAGPATTVFCHVGDNLTLHKAIEIAAPGDVLVVEAGGYKEGGGMWGEIMSFAAKTRGIEGLVMDGAIRDVKAIRDMAFKVFARAVSPGGTVKATMGRINEPVVCAGLRVCPGDIIVGDDDGVVAVPAELVNEVLQMAERRAKEERKIKRLVLQGKTTMEIYGFDKATKSGN